MSNKQSYSNDESDEVSYSGCSDDESATPPQVTIPPRDPRSSSNFISRLFLWWIVPLILLAIKRSLKHTDLYAHPTEVDSKRLLDKFNRYWDKELRRSSPRLWYVIFVIVWQWIVLQHVLYILHIIATFSGFVLLGYLTEFLVSPDDTQTRTPYLFALGIAMCAYSSVAISNMSFHIGWMVAMRVKVILTGAIYQKVLALSQATVGQVTVGHVINVASNDIRLIDDALFLLPAVAGYPVLLISGTIVLYSVIGVYTVLPLTTILVCIPLQLALTKAYNILRLKGLRQTDSRVKVMNEIISGMRVIKMYAWEYAFKKIVDRLRRTETYILIKGAGIHAINLSMFTILNVVTVFILFISTTHLNYGARQLFTVLGVVAFFRRETVEYFVYELMKLSDVSVATKRVQNLLCLDEIIKGGTSESSPVHTLDHVQHSDIVDEGASSVSEPCPVISVNRMSSAWRTNKPVLTDISFTVNSDSPLLAVVGAVGSGKSSLLQCLLRELPAVSGDVTVTGSVAYASQESWVYSATLRENILFGLPYSPGWYNRVVKACALERDLELLPNGDLTLVGERGVALSGGQKARVNLARAVYRNADVYLLDDPLSAVDAAVSRHIFNRCIKDLLCTRNQTCVVLVTHQLQYIRDCDNVLVLKEGAVSAYGHPSKVIDKELMMHDQDTSTDDFNLQKNDKQIRVKRRRKSSVKNTKDYELASISEEDSGQGGVSMYTYYQYFKTGGGYLFTIFVFVLFFVTEVGVVLSDWWLTVRPLGVSSNGSDFSNVSVVNLTISQWSGVYAGLVGTVVLLSIARMFLVFVLLMRASHLLHNKMFAAVLRAPVLFFDTNPVGRILNRFSKDIGYMDDQLQVMFALTIMMFAYFCGVFALAVAANPWIFLAVIPLVAVFVLVRWLYVTASRNFKRLEALARSPIYSHLSTTLQGLPVIRSYSMQSAAISKFHDYQNNNTQAGYLYIASMRWGIILNDIMCSTFLVIFAFVSVLLLPYLDGTLMSLALTYTMTLSNQAFAYILWSCGDVESYMVSAERVMAYGRLEPEASLETHSESDKPPPDWPNKGHIEMSDVTYRHSPEGPLVLKGVSATILPSEKIGIVGRTGAGKSSLIATLFRLAEPGGSIKIDGVECLHLGLHDVRSRISIIPQDPVLFSGTVRYNMDPFQQYNDHDLWKALEQVQLSGVVENLEGKLNAAVSEGGTNFSVGQRQLFCLARALLRMNQILVLDEATANVDLETDSIIQNIIRDEFCDQTVLTIAHRLDTVMDSDKIMVLQTGELCEYGEPYELLSDPNSYLLRLVDHTGPVAAQNLKNIAFSAHQHRLKAQSNRIYCTYETPL